MINNLNLLTVTELDILRRIARGSESKEMQNQLGISENTLHTHIARIKMKLGVSGRTGRAKLVIIAYETGLVKVGENEWKCGSH